MTTMSRTVLLTVLLVGLMVVGGCASSKKPSATAAEPEGQTAATAPTQSLRLRGPSNSQNQIFCQVPSRRRPPLTMTVTELPHRVAFRWAAAFPSA